MPRAPRHAKIFERATPTEYLPSYSAAVREGLKVIIEDYLQKRLFAPSVRSFIQFQIRNSTMRWAFLCFTVNLVFSVPSIAQPQQSTNGQHMETESPADNHVPNPPLAGSISGTIVDATGAAIAGALVTLTGEEKSAKREILSGDDGQFAFSNVPPGMFQIAVTAPGFAPASLSSSLHPGEIYLSAPIALAVAESTTEVRVVVSRQEVAEAEVKAEEKQRVLGFIPNFYVSYIPDAEPLTSKQKFELAWRSTIDPVTFLITAASAGIEQADGQFSGYGRGAQAYGKRFGAAYADTVTGTFIGSAILPSFLRQDPRYFYKGTGGTRSRFLYAIANSVICKGDNRRWQPNYSNIGGSLASGAISNTYYPAKDRGAQLTIENAFIGVGVTALANLFQEFIVRKFTPNLPNFISSKS